MAEQHVSAILEQVRAIKSDKSSPQFVDAMESLVFRLETIRFKMDALKHRPLLVQLSRIEIDGCALDEVLYDIEDLFSGSNTQLMQSNIQTDASETLKVSKRKTKHSGVSVISNPKSTIRIAESMTMLNIDSLYPNIMDLDARFVSSLTRLEVELMDLKSKLSPGPESVSVEVSKLYGIRQVKKDILDVILGESSEERSDDIKTISIVGMEGMGKTSLARCICRDDRVVASFDNIIFVNVSDDFDLGKIARAIIQALEGLKHEFLCILTLAPLQSLLDRIHRKIVNEKSLLVLDGVEGYDCDDWLAFKAVFQHGMPESRILITTREHKVAVAMESSFVFRLKELSDELCWTILRGVASDGLNKDSHDYVEDLSLEIAKKCEGSPFAAKILGAGSKELKILPETLCDLYNLQSLDLTGCSSLTKLPDGMGKLMKLMYLYTWYCSSITFYPKGIGCLIFLRELTNVIVRVDHNDAKEFSLGDFEALNHLSGDVRVKLVGNVIDADEAIRANLWNKNSLNNIRINLDGDIKEEAVIKALKSPSDLGIEFIGWWF
ncbi:hypothetical protein V6N11_079137 [Hibiscus sabdariffa]|uniref:NB-ARC domain-containing protein n=1 Tax=Hibiscus sabdariffa TaxID=183260 RepID=A0ABR2RVA1_9ROSI